MRISPRASLPGKLEKRPVADHATGFDQSGVYASITSWAQPSSQGKRPCRAPGQFVWRGARAIVAPVFLYLFVFIYYFEQYGESPVGPTAEAGGAQAV